jgi:hypothetical protein
MAKYGIWGLGQDLPADWLESEFKRFHAIYNGVYLGCINGAVNYNREPVTADIPCDNTGDTVTKTIGWTHTVTFNLNGNKHTIDKLIAGTTDITPSGRAYGTNGGANGSGNGVLVFLKNDQGAPSLNPGDALIFPYCIPSASGARITAGGDLSTLTLSFSVKYRNFVNMSTFDATASYATPGAVWYRWLGEADTEFPEPDGPLVANLAVDTGDLPSTLQLNFTENVTLGKGISVGFIANEEEEAVFAPLENPVIAGGVVTYDLTGLPNLNAMAVVFAQEGAFYGVSGRKSALVPFVIANKDSSVPTPTPPTRSIKKEVKGE